jgi:hypothetical protein
MANQTMLLTHSMDAHLIICSKSYDMVALINGKIDKSYYLPLGKSPALKAASPVAFFCRAVSKFLSIVSGSTAIDVERGE